MSGWDEPPAGPRTWGFDPVSNNDGDEAAATDTNPQAKGWGEKIAVDYDAVNNKDSVNWGFARQKYDYIPDADEDIGPELPELEAQLFNFDHKVVVGDKIGVVQEVEVLMDGPEPIQPINRFEDAGLHPVILKSIRLSRYLQPTPVQMYTIPAVMKGNDVVAVAQTGSGKTGAYMIPVLSRLMGKAKKIAKPRPHPLHYDAKTDAMCAEPLVLIVCPTRELAIQIFDEARRLCYRSMLRPCVAYGGGPRREQLADLQRGCDILIGTPGRLKDFLENSSRWLSLRRVQYTILDEADEMLKESWDSEMAAMLGGGVSQADGNHQYMFFSATFPKEARTIAQKYLQEEHLFIKVGRIGSVPKNVLQNVVWVEEDRKREALVDLILSEMPCRTLIFTNMTIRSDELDDFLFNRGFPVTCINSGRTQGERESALNNFITGRCPLMVASGITSRGIDVPKVMHIINYDLPSADHGGITEYTHRIGRTARMGNLGKATSFYNDRNAEVALPLVKLMMEAEQTIPDFLEEFKPAELTWEEDASDDDIDNGAALNSAGGDTGGWGAGGTDAGGVDAPTGAAGWGAANDAPAPAASLPWGSGDARNMGGRASAW